jgi:protein-S-isoprenylcysteine O-methyltransferase Ste14
MKPTKKAAKIASIIMHIIVVFCIVVPPLILLNYSDTYNYDELLNIPSFHLHMILKAVAIVIMIIGLALILIAIMSLAIKGGGSPAIALTEKLANDFLYKYTRNPLIFGVILFLISTGFLIGSSFYTLWALIGYTSGAILYLKLFEETELEIRFGQSYLEYKKSVPFLIPGFKAIGTYLTNRKKNRHLN